MWLIIIMYWLWFGQIRHQESITRGHPWTLSAPTLILTEWWAMILKGKGSVRLQAEVGQGCLFKYQIIRYRLWQINPNSSKKLFFGKSPLNWNANHYFGSFGLNVNFTVVCFRFHPNLILGGTYSGQIVLWDNRVQKRTPIQRTPLSATAHTVSLAA